MRIHLHRAMEVLVYHPDSGTFTWKISRQGKIKAGDAAGSLDKDGYVVIKVDQIRFRAHQLVWLIETGEWPNAMLDHRNGQKDDNRFGNLRKANHHQNGMNRGPQKNNKSGYKGVFWDSQKEKWHATICIQGKRSHIGYFDCVHEAGKVREECEKRLVGEYARKSSN